MEESAWKEANCSSGEEHDYGPSWHFIWVGSLLVQLHVLKIIRIYRIFEVLYGAFELFHPISTNLFIELLDKHRSNLLLKLQLRFLKLSQVCLQSPFDIALKALDLRPQQFLEVIGTFLKLFSKLQIIIQNSLLKLLNLNPCPLWKGVVLCNQWKIVNGMHVVIHSSLDLLLARVDRPLHGLSIDDDQKGYQEDYDYYCRQTVAPDVDAFVVQHE